MGEMIDRAKYAIKQAIDPDAAVLAVIEAMKVPTPEMLAAAAKLPRTSEPSEIWLAMVDAATR